MRLFTPKSCHANVSKCSAHMLMPVVFIKGQHEETLNTEKKYQAWLQNSFSFFCSMSYLCKCHKSLLVTQTRTCDGSSCRWITPKSQYFLPLTRLSHNLTLFLTSLAVLSFSLPLSRLFLLLTFGPYTRLTKNSPAPCTWRFQKMYLLVYK